MTGRHCRYSGIRGETARCSMGARSPAVTPNRIREAFRELPPPGTVSMEISGRRGDCHTRRAAGEITERTKKGSIIPRSVEERFTRLAPETRIVLTEKREAAEDVGEAGLDLGDLQQVLRDEELARKMQEDEEKCLRRNSQSSPPTCYPEGDFRAAQVAQDEEIAHFMQKQEMKSKRRSRELEGPSSWREHRAMISQHDRRAARDRQVQRERLDSEGLPSPTEDCSPENQQPSPTSTTLHSQYGIRNIAEELDPTFQARRQSTGRDQEGQTGM
ncbi:unnamed protein product [Tetraodon nigroviridis]|uniref:Chromosome 9 SCAF14729, whole genome shotgun sequence n=1 Tax=Tetraodon nigroviridis TaxID=99883 RepID=Q4S5U3_TETNG|nr:unnamed protein product [Tetraodon nigroviridis]